MVANKNEICIFVYVYFVDHKTKNYIVLDLDILDD